MRPCLQCWRHDRLRMAPFGRALLHSYADRPARSSLRPLDPRSCLPSSPSLSWPKLTPAFAPPSHAAVNGRHLGHTFTEVWGTLVPAVDFDSPGASIEQPTYSHRKRLASRVRALASYACCHSRSPASWRGSVPLRGVPKSEQRLAGKKEGLLRCGQEARLAASAPRAPSRPPRQRGEACR